MAQEEPLNNVDSLENTKPGLIVAEDLTHLVAEEDTTDSLDEAEYSLVIVNDVPDSIEEVKDSLDETDHSLVIVDDIPDSIEEEVKDSLDKTDHSLMIVEDPTEQDTSSCSSSSDPTDTSTPSDKSQPLAPGPKYPPGFTPTSPIYKPDCSNQLVRPAYPPGYTPPGLVNQSRFLSTQQKEYIPQASNLVIPRPMYPPGYTPPGLVNQLRFLPIQPNLYIPQTSNLVIPRPMYPPIFIPPNLYPQTKQSGCTTTQPSFTTTNFPHFGNLCVPRPDYVPTSASPLIDEPVIDLESSTEEGENLESSDGWFCVRGGIPKSALLPVKEPFQDMPYWKRIHVPRPIVIKEKPGWKTPKRKVSLQMKRQARRKLFA